MAILSKDRPLEEWAKLVHAFMWDERTWHTGRKQLICETPVYPYLMETFGLTERDAKRIRTKAVRLLTEQGKVLRLNVRGIRVSLLFTPGKRWGNDPDFAGLYRCD